MLHLAGQVAMMQRHTQLLYGLFSAIKFTCWLFVYLVDIVYDVPVGFSSDFQGL